MTAEKKAPTVIGIGEFAVSKLPGEQIKTYALGSCVAVILYLPHKKAGSMVHVALFDSALDPPKSKIRPGHFADTAIPALIHETERVHGPLKGKETSVYLAGGAAVFSGGDYFRVGEKNRERCRELITAAGLRITAEDTGGEISRTATLDTLTGTVTISNPARGSWKL